LPPVKEEQLFYGAQFHRPRVLFRAAAVAQRRSLDETIARESIAELMARANASLTAARRRGRNQVGPPMVAQITPSSSGAFAAKMAGKPRQRLCLMQESAAHDQIKETRTPTEAAHSRTRKAKNFVSA
jgi:hypothetical protein